MADEDKSPPRDWGHHNSPFFKLAPEIRNKIYHETFSGSERDLTFDPPIGVKVVPATGRLRIFSTAKSAHHFLLTCFQVYSEALAIYWSLTVLRNGNNGHFTRNCFLNRIPAIARKHVHHLRDLPLWRGMSDKWMQDEAFTPDLSTAQCLDLFPNLKSCSFLEWRPGPVPAYTILADSRPNIRILVKRVRLLHHGAQVPPITDSPGYRPYSLNKIDFEDITTGRSLTWYQPLKLLIRQYLGDEAACMMVMDPAPNEIEATESRLKRETLLYFTSSGEE